MVPSRVMFLRWSLLASVAALLLAPPGAWAHAGLGASVPARDTTVTDAPTEVILEFSAPVVVSADGVQVFAPDGRRVDVGAPRPNQGTRISQPTSDGGTGTYGIAYRVSSEDGHVITGVVSFSVGAPSDAGAALGASRDAAQVPRATQLAFSGVRLVEVLALLVAAGGGIFAVLIAPGVRPRLLITSIVTLLLAYLAAYALNAAIAAGGGISATLDGDALRGAAETPFSLSLQIRTIVALAALAPAVLLTFSTRTLPLAARWVLAVVFAALAASLSITGHAVTTQPTWLRMPLDMVHVIAAALWLGGLVQLWTLAREADTRIVEIARFSRMAFIAVGILLATGVATAIIELDLRPAELVDSRYGRLVFAKLLLLLGIIPLAFNNQRIFVPALRRRPADAPRMLRQYVLRELALLIAVITLTVWLIATPQP